MHRKSIGIAALALFAVTLTTTHPAAPAAPREGPAAREQTQHDAKPVILAQNGCSNRGCP